MTIHQFEKAKPLYNQIESYKKLITKINNIISNDGIVEGLSPIITHGFLKKDFLNTVSKWIEGINTEIKRLEKEIERI
jgi:archaellum component FlaC